MRFEALRYLGIHFTLVVWIFQSLFSIYFASQRVTFCGKSNQNHWGEVICLVTDSACAGGVWAILPPQTTILILLFVGLFRFNYDDVSINKQQSPTWKHHTANLIVGHEVRHCGGDFTLKGLGRKSNPRRRLHCRVSTQDYTFPQHFWLLLMLSF